jgi:ribonuclease R
METKADQAERSSIKYKQIEFLQDKTRQQFDGLISGVSKWGIYVEIVSNKCEGMIPIAELNDDFYYIDENNYCLIGQKKGNKYKLGDKIKITVKQADLRKRQLTFALA